jgi:hypothetical protein
MRKASAICCVAGSPGWQQNVVAVMRAVEPLGQRVLGVVEIGDRLVGRQRGLLPVAPEFVDRDIAADHDQPCRGIAWRPVLRPGL